MAYSAVPTVVTGDSWSAANHNTYLRDNLAALWPYTTAGDIAVANSATSLGKLGVGAAGDGLKSSSDGLPAWQARKWGISFPIGNGMEVISTGLKYAVEIPANCYIDQVSLLSLDGISGSIVVNIWRAAYANLPATAANKITASAPPTISSGTKSQDTTLTGWERSILAGDWLYVNVDSVTSLKNVIFNVSGHQL